MLVYLLMIENPEDRILFGELYIKYKKQMAWKAFEILQNHSDVEDAVHDAFTGIAGSMDAFHEVKNVKSYVLTCVEHAAVKKLEERNGIYVDDETDVDACPTPALDLDDENRVVQCINELTQKEREILKLHDIYGLSLAQCAEQLEITEDAARQRHARAKRKLRELCKKEALL